MHTAWWCTQHADEARRTWPAAAAAAWKASCTLAARGPNAGSWNSVYRYQCSRMPRTLLVAARDTTKRLSCESSAASYRSACAGQRYVAASDYALQREVCSVMMLYSAC